MNRLKIYILLLISFNSLAGNVEFKENKIFVNDNEFYIKGICYHPVEKGKVKRTFAQLERDLTLMKEAGINTIRVYKPIIEKAVLDKINSYGLKVVISFGYNQNGNFDIRSGSYIDYIKYYDDHPAILFWELGNEYNFHPEWFDGDIANWYKSLDIAALEIKKISSKPVSTAHGEMPDSLAISMVKNIDFWGVNVYRWDKPETLIKEWVTKINKPLYFAEVGSDSYMTVAQNGYDEGINERAQSDANTIIVKSIMSNENNMGLFLFQFVDGLWKAGWPNRQDIGGWAPNSGGVPYDGTANEEFFGIVDIDRNKKQSFDALKEAFKEN
jgi:hypothetical protein